MCAFRTSLANEPHSAPNEAVWSLGLLRYKHLAPDGAKHIPVLEFAPNGANHIETQDFAPTRLNLPPYPPR